MTTETLDQELHSIMDDLEKSALTPEGGMRASFLIRDVGTLAKLWDSTETRPQADAMLNAWSQMDGLRKRIASHWIERAKSIVETGMTPAKENKAIAETAKAPMPGNKAIAEKKVHPLLAKFRALQVTNKRVAA
jgi:hypothetical protein